MTALNKLKTTSPNHPSLQILAAQLSALTGNMEELHGFYMDAVAEDIALIHHMNNGLENLYYQNEIEQQNGNSVAKIRIIE